MIFRNLRDPETSCDWLWKTSTHGKFHGTTPRATGLGLAATSWWSHMGMAQKTGMDRSAGDPDVWIGLDHLRFGMDMDRMWYRGMDRNLTFWAAAIYNIAKSTCAKFLPVSEMQLFYAVSTKNCGFRKKRSRYLQRECRHTEKHVRIFS